MTPPQTPWQKAAEEIIAVSIKPELFEGIIKQACEWHAAQLEKQRDRLLGDCDAWSNSYHAMKKERDEILKFGSTTSDLRQAIEENEKEREWVLQQHEQLKKERDCWIFNAKALQAAYNKLDKENAELKADSERLDWIEVNVRTNDDKIAKWNFETFKSASLREVIDLFRHPTPESK